MRSRIRSFPHITERIRHWEKAPRVASIWSKKGGSLMKSFLCGFAPIKIPGKRAKEYEAILDFAAWESPLEVRLYEKIKGGEELPKSLGTVKFGFEEDAITFLPQGERGAWTESKRFESIKKEKWPNFLIGLLEERAKGCGYKTARIPVPETLYFYKKPIVVKGRTPEQAREQMKKFLEGIADAMGYEKEGNFFVKNLN